MSVVHHLVDLAFALIGYACWYSIGVNKTKTKFSKALRRVLSKYDPDQLLEPGMQPMERMPIAQDALIALTAIKEIQMEFFSPTPEDKSLKKQVEDLTK